jgi:hypothetical protein
LDPPPPVRALFERDRAAENAKAEAAAEAPGSSGARVVTD